MMNRWWAAGIGAGLMVATALSGRSQVAAQAKPPDGTLLSQAGCTLGGDTFDAYVAAIKSRPGADPKDTPFDEATFRRNTPAAWFTAIQQSSGVRCRKISYASDGLRVTGFIVEPTTPGPHPAVVFNRGGNQAFGAIRTADLMEFAGWALDGYVVLASQYRGNDGGEGKEEFGGADVNDVVNLFALARTLPSVDGNALFMYGFSRGGMMTYQALRRGVPVKAAAVIGGSPDLAEGLRHRPEMEEVYRELMPDYGARKAEHLQARSASAWVDDIRVPVLMMHGGADWRVWPGSTLSLASALQALGKPYELVVYGGDDHPLTRNLPDARARLRAWFARHR